MVSIQELIQYRKRYDKLITKETEVNMPTAYGEFKLVAYTEKYTGKEHVALYKGELTPDEPTLVRVHSECLTGDAFGSQRCDCGPQLKKSVRRNRKSRTRCVSVYAPRGPRHWVN